MVGGPTGVTPQTDNVIELDVPLSVPTEVGLGAGLEGALPAHRGGPPEVLSIVGELATRALREMAAYAHSCSESAKVPLQGESTVYLHEQYTREARGEGAILVVDRDRAGFDISGGQAARVDIAVQPGVSFPAIFTRANLREVFEEIGSRGVKALVHVIGPSHGDVLLSGGPVISFFGSQEDARVIAQVFESRFGDQLRRDIGPLNPS